MTAPLMSSSWVIWSQNGFSLSKRKEAAGIHIHLPLPGYYLREKRSLTGAKTGPSSRDEVHILFLVKRDCFLILPEASGSINCFCSRLAYAFYSTAVVKTDPSGYYTHFDLNRKLV